LCGNDQRKLIDTPHVPAGESACSIRSVLIEKRGTDQLVVSLFANDVPLREKFDRVRAWLDQID